MATTDFGGSFPSVVARERILAVQFHPERSGADGLQDALEPGRPGGW